MSQAGSSQMDKMPQASSVSSNSNNNDNTGSSSGSSGGESGDEKGDGSSVREEDSELGFFSRKFLKVLGSLQEHNEAYRDLYVPPHEDMHHAFAIRLRNRSKIAAARLHNQEGGSGGGKKSALPEGAVVLFLIEFFTLIGRKTHWICIVLMIVMPCVHPDLLAVVYPITYFGWGALTRPQPTYRFWLFAIFYTVGEIFLRYAFQLEFWGFNDQPDAGSPCHPVEVHSDCFSAARLIGITRLSDRPEFLTRLIPDILLLISLFLNRIRMQGLGVWRPESDLESIDRHELRHAKRVIDREEKISFDRFRRRARLAQVPPPLARQRYALSEENISASTGNLPGNVSAPKGSPPQPSGHRTRPPRNHINTNRLHVRSGGAGAEDFEYVTGSEDDGHSVSSWGPARGGAADARPRTPVSRERVSLGSGDNAPERLSLLSRLKSGAGNAVGGLVGFVRRVVDTKGAIRRDYYFLIFLAELSAFLTVVFGWAGFQRFSTASSASDILEKSDISPTLLAFMLAHFLLMVFDRMFYLMRSLRLKLLLHYILLALVHAWVFFLLPENTNKPFSDNTPIIVLYVIYILYFMLSAAQIRSAYPLFVLNNILTQDFSKVGCIVFIVYRAIPFVHEIRVLLDWTSTPTTIDFFQWLKVRYCLYSFLSSREKPSTGIWRWGVLGAVTLLNDNCLITIAFSSPSHKHFYVACKVDDIYSQLYRNKASIIANEKSPRKHGEKLSLSWKVIMGAGFLLFLLLIVWSPLLVISLFSGSTVPNRPTSISVQLQVNAYEPLFEAEVLAPRDAIDEASLQTLRSFDSSGFIQAFEQADVQRALVSPQSQRTWAISPAARDQLRNDLLIGTALSITFSWVFERGHGVAAARGQREIVLLSNSTATQQLVAALDGTPTAVFLQDLFPSVIELTDQSESVSQENTPASISAVVANCTLSRQSLPNDSREWWTLAQVSKHVVSTWGVSNQVQYD